MSLIKEMAEACITKGAGFRIYGAFSRESRRVPMIPIRKLQGSFT